MSYSPPPYDSNPDKRPLPDGWISQYDSNYKTWFYVNTRANPPTTTWIHPSGPVSAPPPPPEPTYSAPAAPPPNSTYPGGYNAGSQGGYPGQGAGNGYPQQQQPYYGDRREYEQNSQNYPQQSEQKGLGGLLGRFTGGGRHGGGGGFGGGGGGGFGRGGGGRFDDEGRFGGGGYPPYQGPQPQVVYAEQQQPPKKSGGIGMGGLALGIGGGLLGGMLIEDMIDNVKSDEYDQGFDAGANFDNDDW